MHEKNVNLELHRAKLHTESMHCKEEDAEKWTQILTLIIIIFFFIYFYHPETFLSQEKALTL